MVNTVHNDRCFRSYIIIMGNFSCKSRKEATRIIKSQVAKHRTEYTPKTPEINRSFEGENLLNLPAKEYLKYEFEAEGSFPLISEDPFAEKLINYRGLNSYQCCSGSKIGVTCRKGLKNDFNQDNFFIVSKPPFLLAGVFDGHGPNGHLISALARKNFPSSFLPNSSLAQNPVDCMHNAFIKTQEEIISKCEKSHNDCGISGCTATIIFFYEDSVFIGQLGDSRAILLRNCKGRLLPIPLTFDHNVNDPEEKARLEQNGGLIKQSSIDDNGKVSLPTNESLCLSVSRAFGDTAFSNIGVLCQPFITEHQTGQKDKFIVMCTDGVWDCIENREVAEILEYNSPESACNIVANLAWSRWIDKHQDRVDDITVLIIPL